jgi:hypothetical protein
VSRGGDDGNKAIADAMEVPEAKQRAGQLKTYEVRKMSESSVVTEEKQVPAAQEIIEARGNSEARQTVDAKKLPAVLNVRESREQRAAEWERRLWIFGKAPLLPGEDDVAYYNLYEKIYDDAGLKDVVFCELWIADINNLTWEIKRYRWMKSEILKRYTSEAIATELFKLADGDNHSGLVMKAAQGEEEAIKQVEEMLATVNLSIDWLLAKVQFDQIDRIRVIDGLIADAEERRNSALHEIERRQVKLEEECKKVDRTLVGAAPMPAK